MRKRLIIFYLLLSGTVCAQPDLGRWMATSNASADERSMAGTRLDPFIQSLTETHCSDQKLLRKTFHRVNSVFLKTYVAYSDFDNVFSSGEYDCLTATALFTYVLDQLRFSYDIVETNYHIFLIVKTSGGDVLIETTDRFGGFVTGKEAIARRIGNYSQNILEEDALSSKHYYRYSFSICQIISPEKLTGLMYFNLAVKAYNQKDLERCSVLLETANSIYASPRCEELGIILCRTLLESALDEKVKAACLERLRNFWTKSGPLASN